MLSSVTKTISHHLAEAAARTPHATAFTFVDFATHHAGLPTTLTWSQVENRVRAAARGMREAAVAGGRVAIVAPQGLEYVVGFLAALCAGAVAVPLYPPSLHGHEAKLLAALKDADPVLAVTTPEHRQDVEKFCADRAGLSVRVVTVEELRTAAPASGQVFHPRPDDCAYLQYTSGSTRTPSGVEITHANVCANARQALEALDIAGGRNCTVGWLPLYHDMGLVLAVALPIVGRVHSVLMDPLAFVQQPVRWLRLLTEHGGALTAAPNFAYDYCVQRVTDEECEELSLGSVAAMINGSEPIAEHTLARFEAAFAPAGLARTAVRPSYGLAEATVFVCTSPSGREPTVTRFERTALANGVARPAEADYQEAVTCLVACGQPTGQEIAIVDPATQVRQEDGHVGEIWLRGPNIGRGYWRQPDRSLATFRATLDGDDPDSGQGWLRTGDLGVWHDTQLYITGRIKDLVIIDGLNHYPQDIEQTVEGAHPAIRRHHTAAFSVASDSGERLVVVAEHSRDLAGPQGVLEEAARAVRAAVTAGHAVAVHDFVLARPGTVPRTTSGKIARSAAREHYLNGTWFSGAHARKEAKSV